MKRILQGVHAVEGVQGTLVVEGTGEILAYQAHAVYDANLLKQVAQTIVSAVDTLRLLQEDWELVSTEFAEGSLLLRNIKLGGAAANRTVVLGIIGDKRLNLPFVTVAIRVAAGKLKTLIESPNASSASQLPAAIPESAMPATPSSPSSNGGSSPTALASSGLSWTGLGASSGHGSTDVAVDAVTSAYLTACTKALAESVGPMAKIFVKDAVRKLSAEHPFSRAQGESLISLLVAHIQDAAKAAEFQRKARSLPR